MSDICWLLVTPKALRLDTLKPDSTSTCAMQSTSGVQLASALQFWAPLHFTRHMQDCVAGFARCKHCSTCLLYDCYNPVAIPTAARQVKLLIHRLLSLAEGLQQNAPPQQYLAAEGALNLALRLGIASHAVMDRLLGPNSRESFYEAYRPVIHTWLIFNASDCAGKLFEALAGSQGSAQHAQHAQRAQRTASAILNGCLESLQRSRDAQAGRADVRQR